MGTSSGNNQSVETYAPVLLCLIAATSVTEAILQHLDIQKASPSLHYLQKLITAYCSRVPWESVSKIIKKASHKGTGDWARLENEFWTSAFRHGTGGTCYESNLAFFQLLQSLGFEGYLTLNRIIDKSSVHSAIIIVAEGKKYIADIGYPTYAPILVAEQATAITENPLITYRCTHLSANEYLVENFPHPKPYLYHLNDSSAAPQAYLAIANDDYGEAGLFSDRVVIRKLINGIPTRFDSEDVPYNIHTLLNGKKEKTLINGDIARQVSQYFQLDYNLIQQAFCATDRCSS